MKIINGILNIFQPAKHKPKIAVKEVVKKQYKYWRVRIIYSLYIGYVFFYFSRKSFTFLMPNIKSDLDLTNAELGFLGSILYITYGFSKFFSGILADKSSPRSFMSIGLIFTGICNILFGMSSSLIFLAFFWGLNGIFQGWGWPPTTKQLTHWYSKSERGMWWSVCSTSHNLGGAIIPLLSVYFVYYYDWRFAIFCSGTLCIVAGIWLFERLRDAPQSLGLPAIEVFRNDPEIKKTSDEVKSFSIIQIIIEVIHNKYIWIFALSYFFLYITRTAMNDWSLIYLMEEKGYSQLLASISVFFFEIGGLVGALFAGWSSDKIFNSNRIPYMLFCTFGLLFIIPFFYYLPYKFVMLDNMFMFLIGFFIFGPQMLVGLAAAEFVDKKAACTANGFAGAFAYIGAVLAGYPLGIILDIWSWYGFFVVIFTSSIMLIFILLPMRYVKN